MLKITTNDAFERVGKRIADTLLRVDTRVAERVQYHSMRLYYRYLEKNNNKLPPYSIAIDGVKQVDLQDVIHARRKVQITFIQAAVDMALAELVTIMRNNMKRYGPTNDWMSFTRVRAHIRVVHITKEGRVNTLSTGGKVVDFKPGEVVFLTPIYPTQVYANATKYGARGFMAKTARAILRKLKLTKKTSPISVRAERSRPAWDYNLSVFPNPKRPDGSEILHIRIAPKPQMISAWSIAIRYKDDKRGNQYGN